MAINREAVPTPRQATVLGTLECVDHRTARWMGVRSDVLWRMEERGWVSRDLHEQWYIRPGGRDALDRHRERNQR